MRVRKLYMHDQIGGGPSGAVTLLILFLFPIGYPWLVQGGLNEHWEMQTMASNRLAQQQQATLQAPAPPAFPPAVSAPSYAQTPVALPVNAQPVSVEYPSQPPEGGPAITHEELPAKSEENKPPLTVS